MTEIKDGMLADERSKVALISVLAAVFLFTLKLLVGYTTNSLGILSEALHSGLDLGAAAVTLCAVRSALKPPDSEHPYGHGKIENFSAFIAIVLLLATCFWIIYEALRRISAGEADVDVTYLSFGVMFISIAVDVSRSRALYKVAKKYDSQALEADALHFSSDILSSSVVIVGLVFVKMGYPIGDPVAALGVAAVIIIAAYRLGKKSFQSLTDRRLPDDEEAVIKDILRQHIYDFADVHNLRTRKSGSDRHVDFHLVMSKDSPVKEAHDLAEHLERHIRLRLPNTKVLIHIEPCEGECEKCRSTVVCNGDERGEDGTEGGKI